MHKDGYDNEIKNSLDKLNPTKEQSIESSNFPSVIEN